MSAENALQTLVGKIADFYSWVADRLNDDAARAAVLIDLGLSPKIAVGAPLPQHQLKGINEYRKTVAIEKEVSTSAAHDLGTILGLSSSKSARLVLPEKSLEGIRAFQQAKDPGFGDYTKALGELKDIFTTVADFIKALDVEGIHDKEELAHRLLNFLMKASSSFATSETPPPVLVIG